MKNIILIFFCFIASCSNRNQETVIIDQENRVGLENELLSVRFDKNTGQLNSLINKLTNDNYLKNSVGGNIFRLYVNTQEEPALTAGAHNSNYGGIIIEPSSCKLTDYTFAESRDSKSLILTYHHQEIPLEILVKLTLESTSSAFNSHLEIKNIGKKTFSIYAAFPYLSGICLGKDPVTNLAVNMWDRGYPGINAWEKNSGGVYGREVSMQWQCVCEPALKEGIAFITEDSLFSNKILSCFPGGGMASLYFDKKLIEVNSSHTWPAVQIMAYSGNWRTAAREYEKWFSKSIVSRKVPKWYKDEVVKRSSTWFPKKEIIAETKKIDGKNGFTSFEQMHSLYKGTYNDCMEIAMWNEDINLWPETYGPWMSSGFIGFRTDLGGEEAFKKGVEKCHKYGKKVGMYVAGYGARKTSPLFEGKWENYAIMDYSGEPAMDYRSENQVYGAFNCPGYKPWQDNLIRVCSMLAEAGVDEIRLDELGFPFRPCFNPEHNHESPYDCNKWMRTLLKRIREATDKINPDLVISTEFFMDYFHESTNGALVMDCSGKEIDAMKIALPNYLALSYHASAPEAAITGAIMNKTNSQRNNWAWPNVGTEKPDDYKEGFVIELLWHELYSTFKDAVTYGEITEWDPEAVNDPKWMGHLWKSKYYWVLTGGHIDASTLPVKEVIVRLPELPANIKKAYEFNIITREMTEITIIQDENGIKIPLSSSVSAVLFPLSNCPPLPIIEQNIKMTTKSEMEVKVSLLASWIGTGKQLDLNSIHLSAPGFEVTKKVQGDGIIFTIHIDEDTPSNDFFYTVSGNCLTAKRWFPVSN
jgi:hypothetical protein